MPDSPTFPDFPLIHAKDRCWCCNQARAKSDIGLCAECRDRLIEEGREER